MNWIIDCAQIQGLHPSKDLAFPVYVGRVGWKGKAVKLDGLAYDVWFLLPSNHDINSYTCGEWHVRQYTWFVIFYLHYYIYVSSFPSLKTCMYASDQSIHSFTHTESSNLFLYTIIFVLGISIHLFLSQICS